MGSGPACYPEPLSTENVFQMGNKLKKQTNNDYCTPTVVENILFLFIHLSVTISLSKTESKDLRLLSIH